MVQGGDSIVDGGGKDVLNGGLGNDILSSDRLDSYADFHAVLVKP